MASALPSSTSSFPPPLRLRRLTSHLCCLLHWGGTGLLRLLLLLSAAAPPPPQPQPPGPLKMRYNAFAQRLYRTRVGRCAERITLPHPSPPVSPHMHDGTRLTAPGSPQPTPHHSGALTVRAHAHVSLKSVPRHAFLRGCGGRLDQHVADRSAHLPGRCRV